MIYIRICYQKRSIAVYNVEVEVTESSKIGHKSISLNHINNLLLNIIVYVPIEG